MAMESLGTGGGTTSSTEGSGTREGTDALVITHPQALWAALGITKPSEAAAKVAAAIAAGLIRPDGTLSPIALLAAANTTAAMPAHGRQVSAAVAVDQSLTLPAAAASVSTPAAAVASATTANSSLLAAERRRQLLKAPTGRGLQAALGCMRFPVIVGEFGSNWEQASDVTWMNDFAGWLDVQSRSVGGPLGWAYWSVNANSGDTGGLVSPNWQTFMWVKLRFLVDKLGLRPWYLA